MELAKADEFLRDVEEQLEWYYENAGPELGDKYLLAVEATCQLLQQHPLLGPSGGFQHPRLAEWRFFVVFRPFNAHVIFYEVEGGVVLMRRIMHGSRALVPRLLEP